MKRIPITYVFLIRCHYVTQRWPQPLPGALAKNFPHLKIYARARNRGHVFQLMDLGVTHIKRETIDSAINFTEELLVDYGLPPQEVQSLVSKFKSYDLETLAEQFKVHSDENQMIAVSKQAAQQFSETLRADSEASISK